MNVQLQFRGEFRRVAPLAGSQSTAYTPCKGNYRLLIPIITVLDLL